jgi:UDP-glucose 4-epimerase|tara:strand:+ start:697 stop:1629 length:933 start_codon:yes stop_codon:yes gene_type:complete
MKILVTGGSGFIGHTLVRSLLDKGQEVIVVDTKPIKFKHEKLTFLQKSIEEDLRADMKGCDAVFHLAALLGVVNSDKNPLKTLRINIDGTVNVFKCAVDAGINHVVYSSSSEIYGEAQEIPLKEDSPKAPVSVYGVSKLAAEMYAQGFVKEHGININPIRFFNVYGPGQRFEWVMSIFIQKVLRNEAPVIFGDGSQVRCFTFVEDIVKGMETVMEKGKKGEAYNIANDQPISMKELAELIIKISGKDLKPKVAGFGESTRTKEREIMKRIPSIEKLKGLGWEPKVKIEEGVKRAHDWYKENMGKEEMFFE